MRRAKNRNDVPRSDVDTNYAEAFIKSQKCKKLFKSYVEVDVEPDFQQEIYINDKEKREELPKGAKRKIFQQDPYIVLKNKKLRYSDICFIIDNLNRQNTILLYDELSKNGVTKRLEQIMFKKDPGEK